MRVCARACLTFSLTAGSSALKQVARNTPPPKALHSGRALRYRRAESELSRRTGTRTPASTRPSRPSRPSSLATRMSIRKLPRQQVEEGGEQVRLTGVLLPRAPSPTAE